MIFDIYLVFAVPLLLSIVITPLVIRFARKIGALDHPDARKVHTFPVPRLGGIAIYVSFFATFLLYPYLIGWLQPSLPSHLPLGALSILALTLVFLLGIWDDLKQLSALKKLAGQVAAATIVYLAGIRVDTITHPFGANSLDVGFLSYPLTVIWIVGVTNALNLIDGLDGLASGIAFIVSITIATISFIHGDSSTGFMAVILAGAVLGFLRYNFNGARIFLGDSGSLFIGFSLAVLTMQSSTKGSAAFSILVPVLALGLPIIDTILSMVRRFLRSAYPDAKESRPFVRKVFSIFAPDRGHIHHQLVARGLSHRNVVLLLYVVSFLFGVSAVAITLTDNMMSTPILLLLGILTYLGINQLGYKEMSIIRNGLLIPLYEWPLINSNFFLGFLDLGFIILAFIVSHDLTSTTGLNSHIERPFYAQLAILCGVQLTVLIAGGLYKGAVRQVGIGDILKIFKTISLAIIFTWTAFAFLPAEWSKFDITFVMLDFYFLLTFMLGARISFQVLSFISRREQHGGKKKTLIYGADEQGLLVIEHLLHDKDLSLDPIGFLDDDPAMEGKNLNGYPVFGSHWKLPRLIKTLGVSEILITSDDLKNEVLRRLRESARNYHVKILKCQLKFDELTHEPPVQVLPHIMLDLIEVAEPVRVEHPVRQTPATKIM